MPRKGRCLDYGAVNAKVSPVKTRFYCRERDRLMAKAAIGFPWDGRSIAPAMPAHPKGSLKTSYVPTWSGWVASKARVNGERFCERRATSISGAAWATSGAAHCGAGCLAAWLPASRRADTGVVSAAQAARQSAAKRRQVFCNGRARRIDERAELADAGHDCHQPTLAPEKRALQTPDFEGTRWSTNVLT